MDNAAAGLTPAVAGGSRRPVIARSVGVLLAWHVLPAAEVAFGTYVTARQSPCADTCGLYGLALFGHLVLLVLSLVTSAVILGTLVLIGRSRPRQFPVALLGNCSAFTGILLTSASVYWIYLWAGTLRAR
ncbi:MAG TPA: hypothetical protein VF834_12435 [Streptosporangiaceae bacterium]